MTQPQLADSLKVFRIQHPDLEGLFGTENAGLEYYSFNDLTNQIRAPARPGANLVNSEKDKDEMRSNCARRSRRT